MNAKKRVLLAIDHKEPDRVPVDYFGAREVTENLLRHFCLNDYDELMEVLGVDFRYVDPREVVYEKRLYRGPQLKVFPDGSWEDIWGAVRKPVSYSYGTLEETCYYPLERATSLRDLQDYRWPDPRWFDISRVEEECQHYEDFAVVGGGWGAVFGDTYRLQGLETFFLNLRLRPRLVRYLIHKVEEFYYELNEMIFEAAEGKMDIYFMGNDFGHQTGLLMSRGMIQEFFLPSLIKFVRQAKSYGMKVMLHSCGAVREVLPDFIKIGIDVLDPAQISAEGMEPEALKKDFGDKLAFHGGIDTQKVTPHASTEEVKEHVQYLMKTMKPGGGFLLCPVNSFEPDTPVENILAVYEAARQYGWYSGAIQGC